MDEIMKGMTSLELLDLGCKIVASLTDDHLSTLSNFIQKSRSKRKRKHEKDDKAQPLQKIKSSTPSNPISECTFVYREDIIPKNSNIYLDVEKIDLFPGHTLFKNYNIGSTIYDACEEKRLWRDLTSRVKHFGVAGEVCLVNESGDVILFAVIKWPDDEICNYYTSISGLTKERISRGVDLYLIQECMKRVLKDNRLVGFGLKGDLNSLLYIHEDREELQEFFIDENNQPYSLATLAEEYYPGQSFQEGAHSSIADARMHRKIHVIKLKLLVDKPSLYSEHNFCIERVKRSKPIEKCSCRKYRRIIPDKVNV
jgi:hypothetical protein